VKSSGKQLGLDVAECFEFQGIAAGVQKEHCGLFAGLAFKSEIRFDDELDFVRMQFFRQRLPAIHRQDNAEVWDGNAVTIDGVDVRRDVSYRTNGRIQVAHHLVPKEIEVDPGLGTTTFTTAEQVTVEGSGFGDITNLKREVKGIELHKKDSAA
tara:strand:+ start:22369 stop:22830 length:462 start_codon:yes stop_codon:yes gene_type:complete